LAVRARGRGVPSRGELLLQNAVWGDGDLKADNQAITDVLGQ